MIAALIRAYRILNILSLDVACGALISALFFARIFEVTIRPYGLAALGLSVWIIYTADHLWDARAIADEAISRRHAFHQKYRSALILFLLFAAIVNGVIIFYVRPQVMIGGAILLLLIAVYLILQRKFHFLKEVLVAILYLSGVMLPSFMVTQVRLTGSDHAIILVFFLITLLNLFIFSWFDAELDHRNKLGSFATRFGKQVTYLVIIFLFVLAFGATFFQLVQYGMKPEWFVLWLMLITLLFIFLSDDFFSKKEYYRLLGDAVFFLPAICFVWPV